MGGRKATERGLLLPEAEGERSLVMESKSAGWIPQADIALQVIPLDALYLLTARRGGGRCCCDCR